MLAFILTMVGLYSADSSGSAPAVMSMSSTMRLLASRASRDEYLVSFCFSFKAQRHRPQACNEPGVWRSFAAGSANCIVFDELKPPKRTTTTTHTQENSSSY